MRVLVATASKHGATAEIGQAIADELTARGVDASVRAAGEVERWTGTTPSCWAARSTRATGCLRPPRSIDRYGETLRGRPVWLFSSGPVGDPPKPEEDPVDAGPMMESCAAPRHMSSSPGGSTASGSGSARRRS